MFSKLHYLSLCDHITINYIMFNKSMIENTKLNCKISVLTVFIGTFTLCKGTIKSLADGHVMLKILRLDLNHLDS